MFKEIGGNFWIEPSQIEENNCNKWDFKFVNEAEKVAYLSSGRSSILLILEQLKIKNKVALLPIYTCESVIQPFLLNKYEVKFYEINKDLVTNEKNLIKCVEAYKPSVVFIQDYFGFNTSRNVKTNYKWLKSKGIIIIEDLTHSSFSKFKKGDADYYIASIRKWLGIPDGAVAITTNKEIKLKKYNINEKRINLFVKAAFLKNEYIKNFDSKLKPEFRKLYYASEDLFDSDYSVYSMSEISTKILCNYNFKNLFKYRRKNFNYLQKELKGNKWITAVFDNLPVDVVPLYFPVYVKCDRKKLQDFLAKNEIYAPIHWPIPEACLKQLNSRTIKTYNNILSLPCDQRYNIKEMERIIDCLNKYSENF